VPAVELVDPVGYSWVWTLVGVVMLVGLVAWYVWLVWSTRKKPGAVEPTTAPPLDRATPPAGSTDPWDPVRQIYLAQLAEVGARHASGELDVRGVHLEIRRVMRAYTKARTGIDAETFTFSDAAKVSLTAPLSKALKQLSYPTFAASSTARPDRSLYRARRVIEQW